MDWTKVAKWAILVVTGTIVVYFCVKVYKHLVARAEAKSRKAS